MDNEDKNLIVDYAKRRAKRRFFRWLFFSSTGLTVILSFIIGLFLLAAVGSYQESTPTANEGSGAFTGEYTEDLPINKDIKGRGPISDEMAQYAVGAAIKYRLLPSVILSQFGWESSYGKSPSAKNDINFFGITWFSGSPFPQGSSRGIGGSEGGFYMKFPNAKASFSYYGYMVATQSNFNQCVGNKDPGSCLLILGRGGYAAAGISENSAYYKGAMGIIDSYKLREYDNIAISKWGSSGGGKPSTQGPTNGDKDFIIPIPNHQVTSEYGYRSSPLGGGGELHNAIDLVNGNPNTPIVAAMSGTVVEASGKYFGWYGNYVVIQHNNGKFTGYAHLSKIDVSVGQKVKQGQQIGLMGTTGPSTGPHLHFQIGVYTGGGGGKWENPRNYIKF